ncbi:PAS domain-containing protein [Hymenobacter sp. HMF4947]|uniref:PAS domain-containing protein n=1 Tax=Hymenobacter ginkgonis TaxID=2682976 RepID=A0A7K1TC12_9BACT|nr:PAS domain-containing protein [Hymenobacter ginkgonis]MVN75948.1 PAS domain-containing protein [Hymenobacter ginkgonis]
MSSLSQPDGPTPLPSTDVSATLQVAAQDMQRQRAQGTIERFFQQAPAPICILDGADFVYELINPAYQQLFPGRHLLGKPLLAALPELAGQAIPQILSDVYRTGETFEGRELLVPLARASNGQVEDLYFNFTYQARRDDNGTIDGVLVFAAEVTEQVLARRKVEELNRELETRVAARTQELEQTKAEAENQRQRLHDILMQAPALITYFEGPQHIFRLVNPLYQQLVGNRPILGMPISEAMPELAGQPIFALLDEVYQTGKSYYANEMLVQLDHQNAGVLGNNYYNFVYQATRNTAGDIDGILVFAYEVTTQVVARQKIEKSEQQLQQLNQQLLAVNTEVWAANAEIQAINEALAHLQEAKRPSAS